MSILCLNDDRFYEKYNEKFSKISCLRDFKLNKDVFKNVIYNVCMGKINDEKKINSKYLENIKLVYKYSRSTINKMVEDIIFSRKEEGKNRKNENVFTDSKDISNNDIGLSEITDNKTTKIINKNINKNKDKKSKINHEDMRKLLLEMILENNISLESKVTKIFEKKKEEYSSIINEKEEGIFLKKINILEDHDNNNNNDKKTDKINIYNYKINNKDEIMGFLKKKNVNLYDYIVKIESTRNRKQPNITFIKNNYRTNNIIDKKVIYKPDTRNSYYSNKHESESIVMNEDNVETHIADYYKYKFKEKNKCVYLLNDFLNNYNYEDNNYKGFYRQLKNAYMIDYLDYYFGKHFKTYCDFKNSITFKNMCHLFLNKNKVIINTIDIIMDEETENMITL